MIDEATHRDAPHPLSEEITIHTDVNLLGPTEGVGVLDVVVASGSLERYTSGPGQRKSREEIHMIEQAVAEVLAPTYPDGGLKAWLVLLGGVCSAMCAFGLVASWGAFQLYYEQHLLSDYSSSTIAWIGSVQTAVCFSICLITGPLFDRYGPQPLLAIGCVCEVVGFCMLSLATKYYQIFLCCILIAIGMDLFFICPMATLGQWFFKKRGIAFGILIGWGWTMRLMALLLGVFGFIAFLLIRTRLPPAPRGPFFRYREFFTNIPYTLVSVSFFINVFGFLPFVTFISTYGRLVGMGGLAPYLLMISNGCSGFGRILGGLAADRFGIFNVTIVATFAMGVLCYGWAGMFTTGPLVVLCVLYGIFSGAPVALQGPMIAATATDANQAGTLIGQSLVIEAVGQVVASPLFGAIIGTGDNATMLHGFKKAILFGATMLTASAFLLIPPRVALSKQWLAKV